MTDVPTVDELDRLGTEELRRRAFARAEQSRDVGFFWDLLRHLQPTTEIAAEDASAGNISRGITDVVEVVRELLSGDLEAHEPLLRARFIDYLRGA